MATQKPISTISYNTEPFLKEKLDTWVQQHIIQAYMYIPHKGEDGDKDHIHLRIEPNRKLDKMDLTEKLKEYTRDNKKPLGVRPWRDSKEEDWILYVVHDKEYLKLKYGGGEKGEKIPYAWTDIKSSEDYDVEIAFIRAKQKLEHTSSNLAHKLQNGANPINLISEGENPYLVNALMRSLVIQDYTRVSNDLATTKMHLDELIYAIEEFGLEIDRDENGCVFLKAAAPAPEFISGTVQTEVNNAN